MRGSSLLVGVKSDKDENDDGDQFLLAAGTLPSDTILTESSFMMQPYAENDGGSDTIDVPVDIGTPTFYGYATSTRLWIYGESNLMEMERILSSDLLFAIVQRISGRSADAIAVDVDYFYSVWDYGSDVEFIDSLGIREMEETPTITLVS